MNKKHFLPNAEDRKNEWYHPLYKYQSKSCKEYKRVEALLDEITCDLINGKSKSDIILALEQGDIYENQTKKVKHRTACDYYRAVISRLQLDEPDKDNARQIFYSMYLNLYREQLEMGNHIGAKATLDSMVKLMGLDKPVTNAIQINSLEDGNVSINFGFEKPDET